MSQLSKTYRVSQWLTADCPRSVFWEMGKDGLSEVPSFYFAQLCESLKSDPHLVFSTIQMEGLDWTDDRVPNFALTILWRGMNAVENEETWHPEDPPMALAIQLQSLDVKENSSATASISLDAVKAIYTRALEEICDALGVPKVFQLCAQVEL